MFNKESKMPKPIKLTKNEIARFEELDNRLIALNALLRQYGLDKRLLWEDLQKKYNLDTRNWEWVYNRKTKSLEVAHPFPLDRG